MQGVLRNDKNLVEKLKILNKYCSASTRTTFITKFALDAKKKNSATQSS